MRVLAGVGNIFLHESRYYGSRVRGWVWAVMWVCVAGAVICGATFGITKAVRAAGAASCRTFARTSGYASTYRIQHWLDAGTCYVHLPSGKALPEKMVTGFLKADK